MLPENHIKEGISRSYIKAICNKAGYNIGVDENDFGFDLTVREIEIRPGGRTVCSGIDLNIQLKCTKNWKEENEHISYKLKNKNYNDLVTIKSNATKRILVVLFLPEDKSEWITQTIESLIIKKCAFWIYMGGQNPVQDINSSTTIKIPKRNLFSEESLKNIMEKIRSGGDLNSL